MIVTVWSNMVQVTLSLQLKVWWFRGMIGLPVLFKYQKMVFSWVSPLRVMFLLTLPQVLKQSIIPDCPTCHLLGHFPKIFNFLLLIISTLYGYFYKYIPYSYKYVWVCGFFYFIMHNFQNYPQEHNILKYNGKSFCSWSFAVSCCLYKTVIDTGG